MRDTFEIHDEIHVSRIGGAVEYRQRMAVREILLFTERLPVIDASRVRNFIDQIRNRQIVAAGGSRTKLANSSFFGCLRVLRAQSAPTRTALRDDPETGP